MIFTVSIYNPQHDKTNKMTCAPSPVWSESSLCAHWIAKDPRFLHVESNTLIRLGACPGWSESSWLAQAFQSLQAPGDISQGSYRVNITGTGSIPFHNSTHVWGKHKSISVFVQTDKAKYKPGDKGIDDISLFDKFCTSQFGNTVL